MQPQDEFGAEPTRVGEPLLITVRTQLDMVSVLQLDAALDCVAPGQGVVLDLSEVDFIDSTGLAAVLRQSLRMRDAGGWLHVRRPSEPVRRLLQFCCLEHLLEPEDH